MTKQSERLTRDSIKHFYKSLIQIGQIAYEAAPRTMIGTVLIGVVQALLPVATAFLFKIVFDRLGAVLIGDSSLTFRIDILPILLIYGVLILISQSTLTLDNYFSQEMGRRLQLHTSTKIYNKLLSLQGMTYFESPRFHDTLKETAERMIWIPAHLVKEATRFLSATVTLVGFFGVILFFSPLLSLILIIATVPAFVSRFRFSRKRFELSWAVIAKRRKKWYLSDLLSEADYAKEIRLFNLGKYIVDQYITTTEEINGKERALNIEELRADTGLNLLSSLITIGTYLFVISRAFLLTITLGDVTLYIEAVKNVRAQLGALSYAIIGLSERARFFTHYQKLMGFETTLAIYDPVIEVVPPLQSKIELRNVAFRYSPESDYVLKDINLTLYKDESLALIGLNGAGKTTLIKLLCRFYDPTEGEILWDGIDIRHFRPEALRERLAAILQDFIRYDLSARENIGLGDITHVDDLEIIRTAAEEMGVNGIIEGLKDGYETVLSRWLVEEKEEGIDLSGGQWQKIAISRAYLRNADLLMLDEPTSALDAEAEHEIYERFEEMAENKATILISHRFSTVRMADKAAVMLDGRIIEYGTHWELLDLKGEYAKLYGMQAKQYQ